MFGKIITMIAVLEIKMNNCYDQGDNEIGVVIATIPFSREQQ